MKILGLDVSTSVTAYTLMDTDLPQRQKVIKYEGIHLEKEKSLYHKAELIRQHFRDLSEEYKIDKVYVEESLQAFRRGLSSAKTLSTLSRFNGVVCFLAEDIFRTEVDLINVLHARSKLGIKINRKLDATVKEQVWEWASNQKELSEIQWPMKILKSGPRKGQEVKDKSCYDIADAAVMALYGLEDT